VGDGQSARSTSVRDWINRIDQQTGDRHLPWLVSLELTERCNLRCVHCYVNRPAGDDEVRRKEMALDEWQGVLDQVADAGTLWLLVTGGEPLLRPDFSEFYLYARRKGLHVILFTNGTLLTPGLADLLAEYPPWEVEITLYGASAETYERITGVPGSYARCRQAIDLLLERELALNLKTMALTLNVQELSAMQRLAGDLGVRFRYDPVVQSRLDGDHRPLACRLSPEEIVALERQDPKRMQQWQEYCGRPWPSLDGAGLFICGAGLGTFHLDPYGGLYPCLAARWLRYELLQGSVRKALGEFLPAVRALPVAPNSTCRKCDLQIICQNCPAWAYREVGDPEAPEAFRCRLAYLRHQDLGLVARVDPSIEETGKEGEAR
jgi:radical SAM protein with 4Fe4S-binding SPASM domain